jgi:hypothetical protein
MKHDLADQNGEADRVRLVAARPSSLATSKPIGREIRRRQVGSRPRKGGWLRGARRTQSSAGQLGQCIHETSAAVELLATLADGCWSAGELVGDRVVAQPVLVKVSEKPVFRVRPAL